MPVSRAAPRRLALSIMVLLPLALAMTGCRTSARPAPLRNVAVVSADRQDGPIVDEAEWGLLHAVADDEDGSRRTLSSFYEGHGAWDEHAAVEHAIFDRVRHALKHLTGSARPSRVPRIGAPRASESGAIPATAPRTVLARWVNRAVLPELYAQREVTLIELEASLRNNLRKVPPGYEASPHARLGDVLCARLQFSEAAQHYDQALAAHRAPYEVARIRARRDDVRRILRPEADHIVGGAATLDP